MKRLRKNAFTLLEMIIVIIVLGVLLSIAVPMYINITEKARTAEAKTSLANIRGAQIRYYEAVGGIGYADDLAKLDVNMDSKYYILGVGNASEASCGSATRNESVEWLGGAGYTLSISVDGNLSAAPSSFEHLL